jgi:type VI secretion system protein ImpL
MIKKLFGWIFHPILLTLVALVIFGVLVWWIGPLVKIGTLEPLAAEWQRAALIAVVVFLVILRLIIRRINAWRASRRLTDGLVRPAANQAALTPTEDLEQKELAKRFSDAVDTLKKMRLTAAGRKPGWRDWLSLSGGSYLYELPWYLFIGAPGSGKTTALVNSGLEFPLAQRFGPGAIRGIGGTRNCDWWFTDQAVLIDTAGRFSTQDSNAPQDKSEWESFLALLKKTHPRRPLNGVFLALSAADLIVHNPEQRSALAAALRTRLLELDSKLATRMPVYVLVTKTDLLYGFMDYFADLGKEQRQQVLGFTLSAQESEQVAQHGIGGAFEREFALLEERLSSGVIGRLQQESDEVRRSAILGFPAQFSSLKQALEELLGDIFTGSRFAQPPWVRGVYFTSGTQEGSPVDRIMGSMARRFGLERALLPAQQGSGRSYFLTTLLREVVFPEARLAGADLAFERRRHALRFAAITAMLLVSIGLLAAWTYSTMQNLKYLKSVSERIGGARDALAALPTQTGSISQMAPHLQTIGDLWRTPQNGQGDEPLSMTLGLYQGDKLHEAAAVTYQKALSELFLPQLERRLDEMLRTASRDNLEFAYESLKAYLMLHQPEHFDANALKAWITLDWDRRLDRSASPEERATLDQQLDALLAQGPPRSVQPMDENLVRSVRSLLASYPLEARIFSRLQRQRVGSDIPAFSIAQAAGPSAPLVLERISGKPLTDGVPGLFTVEGYRKRFQIEAVRLSSVMAVEEPWVLGLERKLSNQLKDVAALGSLIDRVKQLYLQAYVKQWDALLGDVRLIRPANMERSIELSRIVSDSTSPLASYLRAVAYETTLIPPAKDPNVITKATDTVESTKKGLQSLFGEDRPVTAVAPNRPIEAIVDDHFATLRKFVMPPSPGQPSPLDDSLKLYNNVYVYLTAVDTAVKNRTALPPDEMANKIKSDAGRLPEPMRSMVENLSRVGSGQVVAAERQNLSTDLKPVTEFCKRAIVGRYPLASSGGRDVLPDDFGQFFAPGGLMDDFFQKRLASMVDTSARPWRYKPVADKPAMTVAALSQFERAAVIRDVFFRGGARSPTLRFDFKPVEMDATITQFALDVDGQIVKYAHGPVVPMSVQWPGPKGSNQVRVQIDPPATQGSSGATVDGAWALFRMLDKESISSAGAPEQFFVTFTIDNRHARFQVTANSVQHPFHLRELREFSCPEVL